MSSIRPASGTVHPEVAADAGDNELLELSDDEVERQLLAAGVTLAGEGAEGADGAAPFLAEEADEDRDVEKSGAWVAQPRRPSIGPVPAAAAAPGSKPDVSGRPDDKKK